jgi:hypothetical protein
MIMNRIYVSFRVGAHQPIHRARKNLNEDVLLKTRSPLMELYDGKQKIHHACRSLKREIGGLPSKKQD